MGAKIQAIEYFLPDVKLSNKQLAKEFPDYDFDKFEQKVGIQNRYITDNKTTAFDLAVGACEKLFSKHEKTSIDYILYCTQSAEFVLPSTSCLLQDKLGLDKSTGALDINLGCSGYPYCLSLAKSLIVSGTANKVLIVTADAYSKYLNPNDRLNRSLFGDAATASIITSSDTDDIGNFSTGTDGSGGEKLFLKHEKQKNKEFLFMDGSAIFDFAKKVIPVFISEITKKNEVKIDQYILHQANKLLLELIRRKIKVEKEEFFIDLLDGGNTVSCTIPIALKKYSLAAFDENEDEKNVLLTGFGVGLSWSGGTVTLRHTL